MEKAPQGDGNHLTAVADLLFDGAELTEEEHRIVIQRGLSDTLSSAERSQVLEYAHEHLTDPEALLDVKLSVAEQTVAGASRLDYRHTRGRMPASGHDKNNVRIRDTLVILSNIDPAAPTFCDAAANRAFWILDRIQRLTPDRDSNPHDYSPEAVGHDLTAFKSEPGAKKEPLVLRASGLLEQWRGRFEAAITSRLLGTEPGLQGGVAVSTKRQWAYYKTVLELAEGFIDGVVEGSSVPEYALDGPIQNAYFRQAQWLRATAPLSFGCDNTVERLVDKAMTHIDVNSEGAVTTCLALYNNKPVLDGNQSLGYPKEHRAVLLDKAIEITRASSRERGETESTQQSFFRFKRVMVPTPSLFEKRRDLLAGQLDASFDACLNQRPEVIAEIVGLYNTEAAPDETSQNDLWTGYGKRVASLGFKNGHYDTDAIQTVRHSLAQFGKVAPAAVTEEAERAVRERLSTSVPTSRSYYRE